MRNTLFAARSAVPGFDGTDFFLVDSFAGASAAAEQDLIAVRAPDGSIGREPFFSAGGGSADAESVRRALAEFPRAGVVQGWVPEVLSMLPAERWAFVHLDVNLYQPTLAALEFFWPRLLPGGVIVADDYGSPFTPGLGWQKSSQPGFTVTAQSVITGGSFVQPLLSIPRLLSELRAQDARTEQAVIAYEKAIQTAFADSEGTLVQLDSDRKRVVLFIDGEARAGRGYRATKLGYDRGLTDLQTALSAEQSWRQIRAQLTGAQVQALRRTVQAYKALGGGWPAEHFPTDKQAR